MDGAPHWSRDHRSPSGRTSHGYLTPTSAPSHQSDQPPYGRQRHRPGPTGDNAHGYHNKSGPWRQGNGYYSDGRNYRTGQRTNSRNVGLPEMQRRYTYERYQMATVIHEVIGNENIAHLEEGASYVQNFEEMSFDIPPPGPPPQIQLDAHGRAHNVIGRVIGNVNSGTVPAGATFTQNFRPRRAYTTDPQVIPASDIVPIQPRRGEHQQFAWDHRSPATSPMGASGQTLCNDTANRYSN